MISETEFHPAHREAPYGADMYKIGQRLKTVPCTREFATVKSTNYALAWHAARQTAGKNWDDILFMNGDSVTEAARSNFFAVIGGVLCTPRDGMLFGVTRKVVMELATELGPPDRRAGRGSRRS